MNAGKGGQDWVICRPCKNGSEESKSCPLWMVNMAKKFDLPKYSITWFFYQKSTVAKSRGSAWRLTP